MNIDMIEEAAIRLKGHIRRTPLLESPAINAIAGRRVLVKPECLQHTGSFKARGAWNAVAALDPDVRARGILAFSSGNHAQGVARAAQAMGAPAVIIMPADAPQAKIDGTRAFGAEVVFYDRAGGEQREAIGDKLMAERNMTLVRPYDEPMVIAGQGTCGLEIAEQAAEAGVTQASVLVCCGGGGLASGIGLACEARAPGLRVHPVEPEEFDDMARSLATGSHQSNTRQSGLCDAIITMSPGQITFPILSRLAGPGLVVSDDEAMRAMALAFAHLKVVAEPGGAVALAAALFHADKVSGEAVICTISGGNVDADVFAQAMARGAVPG